jgi:hypothetical protein
MLRTFTYVKDLKETFFPYLILLCTYSSTTASEEDTVQDWNMLCKIEIGKILVVLLTYVLYAYAFVKIFFIFVNTSSYNHTEASFYQHGSPPGVKFVP